MNIFKINGDMLLIVVIACIIVFCAMMLDLASGLYKARQRGEVHTSWGLKRSISKFITYEGSMLIAAGVDILIHFSKLLVLFRLDVIVGIPVMTCFVGVFLLIIEFISIREKADKKTRKNMSDAAALVARMLTDDSFKNAVKAAAEHCRQQTDSENSDNNEN